jgi:hypothetical protein
VKILRDRHDKLFTSVINLLEDDSLPHTEIMESSHTFASSAIRKAIQKIDMSLDRKAQLERELK